MTEESMIDILAPLGLLAMLAIVAVVIIAARRQRATQQDIYKAFADHAGFSYREIDDGTAETLSQGFEDFARFSSPSLGPKPAANVVTADLKDGRLCLFTHGTREVEGEAREWFVCLTERQGTPCADAVIRCLPRNVRRVAVVGGPPAVPFADDPTFDTHFEVRSNDADSARRCLTSRAREFLVTQANDLPFMPEVQLLERRIAAYPAGRNESIDSGKKLSALVDFARGFAASLN
jgi:hypothetical protein